VGTRVLEGIDGTVDVEEREFAPGDADGERMTGFHVGCSGDGDERIGGHERARSRAERRRLAT
jgi:hypothetical protein